MKPTEIIKAAIMCWLKHGEACTRVISQFVPLIDALDVIYMKKGDAEAKYVQDTLLEPDDIICMLLMLAEKLVPINLFLKFLQTGTLIYNSISAKLNCLLDCLAKTEEELQNHDSTETDLKFFSKALSLLKLSSECNDLGLT